jgi:hypothetical protein
MVFQHPASVGEAPGEVWFYAAGSAEGALSSVRCIVCHRTYLVCLKQYDGLPLSSPDLSFELWRV